MRGVVRHQACGGNQVPEKGVAVHTLLLTTLISLPLIHLISLPRFAAMFPEADFSSPAAVAHAREQITDVVLRGILTPATSDVERLAASYGSQATLAPSAEEA
jgi:predicted helicase